MILSRMYFCIISHAFKPKGGAQIYILHIIIWSTKFHVLKARLKYMT